MPFQFPYRHFNFASLVKAIRDWLARLLARRCWPKYEPDKWNMNGVTLLQNNCYNYACNFISNSFAQPGRVSKSANEVHSSPEISCARVVAAAQDDGLTLEPVDMPCSGPDCAYHVALVVAPQIDFHWYRLDDTGNWSHKPGQTQVRDYDNYAATITDPRTCERAPYTDFCGFFCVRVTQMVS
jgi:hypothetical protein